MLQISYINNKLEIKVAQEIIPSVFLFFNLTKLFYITVVQLIVNQIALIIENL